jgi:hypothetical protein
MRKVDTEDIEKEFSIDDLKKFKVISEEETELFVRKIKGHLKGIIAALEEFMLSTTAKEKSRRK